MNGVQPVDKMMVRLPNGLRKAIKVSAAENNRTMSAEVVYHLKRIYNENEKGDASRS